MYLHTHAHQYICTMPNNTKNLNIHMGLNSRAVVAKNNYNNVGKQKQLLLNQKLKVPF